MPRRSVTYNMIEAFHAVVLHGGVSAGADALGTPQPSISRTISELQELVGFPLFVKHGRTVKPTQEALILMKKVQQSFIGLEEIERFANQLRKQKMGRLAICSVPSLGQSIMPEIVARLISRYPDVIINLTVSSYIEVARNVRNRQADFGVTADNLSIGGLETVAEFTANCVCIGTSQSIPPDAILMRPEDFLDRPFVNVTGTFQNNLAAWLAASGQQPTTVAEVSLFNSASEIVLQGAGISIVDPLTGARHRQRGGVTLPLQPTLAYKVYVTALSDTRLSEPARSFIEYLEAAIERETTHNTLG